MTAKFITLEGIEGAGKSTAIATISKYLSAKNIEHILTREPGGTAIGEKIREVLLDSKNTGLCSDTELLLMFAARAQHIFEVINPALTHSKWVISDRFTDATYAYQGGGRENSFERIKILENMVQADLRPDLVLVLDIDPEAGMQRVDTRGQRDRFETEKLAFFEAVRKVYLQRAESNPGRYAVIDASQSIADVDQRIQAAIAKIL